MEHISHLLHRLQIAVSCSWRFLEVCSSKWHDNEQVRSHLMKLMVIWSWANVLTVCSMCCRWWLFFSPGGLIPVLLSALQGKWVWSWKLPELILHFENCFCPEKIDRQKEEVLRRRPRLCHIRRTSFRSNQILLGRWFPRYGWLNWFSAPTTRRNNRNNCFLKQQ